MTEKKRETSNNNINEYNNLSLTFDNMIGDHEIIPREQWQHATQTNEQQGSIWRKGHPVL